MRLRTGPNPDDWQDLGPSQARLPGHRGHIVTGDPGVVEKGRIQSRLNNAAARQRLAEGAPPPEPRKCANRARFYATDEERLAARAKSFRESKARARAARKAA